jgi:c-di-GMP-binding flagellar brake protein YcgR
MDEQDRRQYKRAGVKVLVDCRGHKFWQYIETKDISAGGMFLATEKIEEPKTKIEVSFEFGEGKDKKIISAEGIVAWSRSAPIKDESGFVQPAGMGIMFTKLTPSTAKQIIDQWVKKVKENGNG